tara:strand:- start:346 stop:576 length:231 start_codon:yes stop_codon:yes gene_type:complete
MNSNYKEYIKQSTIATIQTLADKVRGRESVANLLQYRYEDLIKHSLSELEQIRDGHIIAYNDMLKSQGKVDGFLSV